MPCDAPHSTTPDLSTASTPADETISATLTSDDDAAMPAAVSNSNKNKQSTFAKHTWIERAEDGYFCKACRLFGLKAENRLSRGVWVTVPLPLSASRKLLVKADKHAASAQH